MKETVDQMKVDYLKKDEIKALLPTKEYIMELSFKANEVPFDEMKRKMME